MEAAVWGDVPARAAMRSTSTVRESQTAWVVTTFNLSGVFLVWVLPFFQALLATAQILLL